MKIRIHNAILILIATGVSLSGLIFLHFWVMKHSAQNHQQQGQVSALQYADGVLQRNSDTIPLNIPVTIASTDATRQQGLSYTASLPADKGMLFIFPAQGKYGFWMKDMHYALDFIWLDAHMNIVSIDHDVTPATYPAVFYSPVPVQYVLEVNADFSTQHNLAIGQQLLLKK